MHGFTWGIEVCIVFLQCKMNFRFLPHYFDFSALAPFFFVHQTSVSDIRYVIGGCPMCLLYAHAKTWLASTMCASARNVIIPTPTHPPPHDLPSIDHVCKCKERHHPHPNPPPTP